MIKQGEGNTVASRRLNMKEITTSSFDGYPANTDGQMDVVYDSRYWAVSILIVGLLGEIGNLLTIRVWTRVKDCNVTIYLFIVLAVSDFLFLLFAQALQLWFFVMPTSSYTLDWVFHGMFYLSFVFQYESIFTTALISTTRYLAVKFPLKINIWMRGKRKAQIFVILTGTLSLLAAIPSSRIGCVILYPQGLTNQMNTTGQNGIYDTQYLTSPQPYATTEDTHKLMKNMSGINEMLKVVPGRLDQNTPTTKSNLNESKEVYPGIELCAPIKIEYQIVIFFLWSFSLNILPWIITVPVNFLLLYEVRKAFAKRQEVLSLEQQDNRALDLIISIITTVSIVAYPVMFLFVSLTNKEDLEYFFQVSAPIGVQRSVSYHMLSAQEILVIINSSFNFITFYACGKRFRAILRKDLCQFRICRPAENTSPQRT